MNSIYFYYYLWIAMAILFLLAGVKLFTEKKKEGTRPFAIGAFLIGIISAISIIKSPSLSQRIEFFDKYSSISSEDISSIGIVHTNNNRKVRDINLQTEISQVLSFLHNASSSYFVFGSGNLRDQYEIELRTSEKKRYFIKAKVYEDLAIIDLTIGKKRKFIGRYINSSPLPPFLN